MQALDDFCAGLGPGDQVPTHTELMRRFGASERMVLRALDEMTRAGYIVRRTGSGTFVTDRAKSGSAFSASPARTVVALARPDHSFFDRCMEQLSQYTEEADLDLVCRPLRPEREGALTSDALGHPYGCIVFGYYLAPLARLLRDGGIRVVLVGTPPYGITPDVSCVYGAQMRGGYLAAKHLLDLGHRRLAFLHGGHDQAQNPRWHGMQTALREAGRAGVSASLTTVPSEDMETWREDSSRAALWLRRPGSPTGVLAWNDEVAIRLLSTLSRAGVQVPEEVSIVGYDALPEGELMHPALTTVEPFMSEMLQTAVELLNQPEPPPLSHTATVVPSLVIRETTAPPYPPVF